MQLTTESGSAPRLLETDVGLAVRPLSNFQGFELRFGYNRTDDVQAHVTRQLVYGAMRFGLGVGSSETSPPTLSTSWPETLFMAPFAWHSTPAGCSTDSSPGLKRSGALRAGRGKAHLMGLADRREARRGEDFADRTNFLRGSGRMPKCAMYLA